MRRGESGALPSGAARCPRGLGDRAASGARGSGDSRRAGLPARSIASGADAFGGHHESGAGAAAATCTNDSGAQGGRGDSKPPGADGSRLGVRCRTPNSDADAAPETSLPLALASATAAACLSQSRHSPAPPLPCAPPCGGGEAGRGVQDMGPVITATSPPQRRRKSNE